MRPSELFVRCAMVAGFLGIACSTGRADDRRLTYSDEARVTPKGQVEFEQWFTWKTRTKDESDYNRFEFKEELEIGITDHAQLGFEIPAWHFQTGPEDEKDGPRLDAFAADIRYIFTDPVADLIGVGCKFEIGISEEVFSLEGKLILQKTWDRFELAYNANIEAEWETEGGDSYTMKNGEFSETLGASYQVTDRLYLGGEFLHEAPMPDWHTGEAQNVFLGPNASFHAPFDENRKNWAITATPLFFIVGGDDEPRFQLRMIFEIEF
ncbi:MAG: hypothetical protein JSR77_11765 [Planctomycetes bacterium]|nr:hypothetical protein [Planctomycetota bacterium]